MPKSKLVVSDTSPLLNLALIDELELLENQFENVKVPEHVWKELQEGEKGRKKLENFKESEFFKLVKVEEDELFHEIFEDIDKGETAAIRYGIQEDADLLLLDEKEGRKVARRHGLEVTGVIGIILKAHENNRIDLKNSLDNLMESGFWVSENLYEKILDKAN